MTALPDDLAQRYLELLEVEARRGGIDEMALRALHRAHGERVRWETIDNVRGRPSGIDPVESVRRFLDGRGGYCFHLNGAFAALLDWLGVDVTRHRAGVQRREDAEPVGATGAHLTLIVRTADGSVWLADVGFGDGPAEPLPLQPGPTEIDGFRFGLGPSSTVPDGWRFDHDPRCAARGFDFSVTAASIDDFGSMHTELSTRSRFSELAIVQRHDGARRESLRGCVHAIVDAETTHRSDVTDEDDWWELVIDGFGLAYDDLDGRERAALFAQVLERHEQWDRAGRT